MNRCQARLLALVLACLTLPHPAFAAEPQSGAAPATPASKPPDNELDAFMEKVLARREVNRTTLEQYILDEVEQFEILGPGRTPLHRTRREYTWYVRDGMHVRSPVRFNGVSIGEEARQRYERDWIKAELARRERKAKRDKEKAGNEGRGEAPEEKEDPKISISTGAAHVGGGQVPTEPRFVSEAYFLEFKFEPGNYYLAGREQLDGHTVLKVEYYPTTMFGDDKDDERRGRENRRGDNRERERQKEAERHIERRMNKTALITLWIDPAEHQIVKYTFDNVWLDFLPGAWLVRVDEMRASMTMGQPFPGVWLPRDIDIRAGITLANGSYEGGYSRDFSQYRLAEVSTRITIPKPPEEENDDALRDDAPEVLNDEGPGDESVGPGSGPFVRETRQPQEAQEPAPGQPSGPEVIGEIRIHGNAFLTDREVLEAAGISVGETLPPDGVETITKRLKASRLFETVEVRKRSRSLSATSDVALVLVVHENPGVRSAVGGVDIPGVPRPVPRPIGRIRSKLMFLPIVSFADGYGFTYGGRFSTVDLLGAGERLSVPLTWGGTRRAALEFDREFDRGPLTRIESNLAIWNRENPRFDIRDQRVELRARAERVLAGVLRAGVDVSRAAIGFGDLDDRLWTVGTSVTVDTRLDPAYPSNAILVSTGWSGLHFRELPERVNRYTADGRGYLRVFRRIVVAGRAAYVGADRTLPPYERLLLGGASSLRGFRTGSFDGDRVFAASGEVRVPLTSILDGARIGVNAFYDAGKAWDVGGRMEDAAWHRGVGAGLFIIASIVKINVDVARGLKTGDTRVHLSSGFSF